MALTGKRSFLQNCVGFVIMTENVVPRCAVNLNAFMSKPHCKCFSVNKSVSVRTIWSLNFSILSSRWAVPTQNLDSWHHSQETFIMCTVAMGCWKAVWGSNSWLNLQVNYWNSNVNEVQGVVIDQEGKVVHRLFGKWHEGLYCGVAPSAKCIWRPGKKLVKNSGRYEAVLACILNTQNNTREV